MNTAKCVILLHTRAELCRAHVVNTHGCLQGESIQLLKCNDRVVGTEVVFRIMVTAIKCTLHCQTQQLPDTQVGQVLSSR